MTLDALHTGIDTNWFKERLAAKQLSQRKLAFMMGLDAAAMSLMLRGKRKMSVNEAAVIAQHLGVSAQEVLIKTGAINDPASQTILKKMRETRKLECKAHSKCSKLDRKSVV